MPLDPWPVRGNRPPSVISGRDADVMVPLLRLCAPGLPEPLIVDVTYNQGTMWQDMPVQPAERCDIDPSHANLTRVCDFRELPPEWTGRFDVLVFDPPHRSEAGKTAHNRARYGLGVPDVAHTPNVVHLFEPALREAKRVLVPGGIVLAKMADMVHRGTMHWQCDELRVAARRVGLLPCTKIVKVDPAQGEQTFVGNVYHPKQRHSEWIVLRNSTSCIRRTSSDRQAALRI